MGRGAGAAVLVRRRWPWCREGWSFCRWVSALWLQLGCGGTDCAEDPRSGGALWLRLWVGPGLRSIHSMVRSRSHVRGLRTGLGSIPSLVSYRWHDSKLSSRGWGILGMVNPVGWFRMVSGLVFGAFVGWCLSPGGRKAWANRCHSRSGGIFCK